MQADFLVEALKASAIDSGTTVTDTETVYDFGHLQDQKSKLGQGLYNFLKPEIVVRSKVHSVHRHLTNTIRAYYRIITVRIRDAQLQMATLNPTSQEATQLKEELAFLDSLQNLLKKISADNIKSNDKINKIEKTLETIIAFGESYALSKAGGYASHYIILLTGLVGLPSLGVTLAFPATQILGAMIAKKYYQNKLKNAEIKGQKIAEDATFGLHQIAINFLEFKMIPKEFQSAPQLKFLESLKKYIALESDINVIIESINNFYTTNQTYKDHTNKFVHLRRFNWIEAHAAELTTRIKEIDWGLKALSEKTGFSYQNSQKQGDLTLEKNKLIAQVTLLKDEQALLKPVIADLLEKGLKITPVRRDPEDHKRKIIQKLNEQSGASRTFAPGIKMGNMQGAKSNKFNLGLLSQEGVVSFSASTPTPTSSLSPPSSDTSSSTPHSDLLPPGSQEEEDGDSSDEEYSSVLPDYDSDSSDDDLEGLVLEVGEIKKEKTIVPQKLETPKPVKSLQEDKSRKIQPSTQREIMTKLDKYINKRASVNSKTGIIKPKKARLSYLRFTGDDGLFKVRSALGIKSVVSNIDRPTHTELLKELHVQKAKYEKHAHGDEEHSKFLIMIAKIETLIENDSRKAPESQIDPLTLSA